MLLRVAALSLVLCCSVYAVPIAEEFYTDRIVGGRPADITDFPWQVSLIIPENRHLCGGSIIGRFTILTVAHCILAPQVQGKTIRIRGGSTTLTSGGYTRDIRKIVAHENFNRTTLDNDIALLFLWYPLIFTDRINAVALPQPGRNLANNEIVHVSGWGRRRAQNETSFSEVLQAVSFQIVDQQSCIRTYSELPSLRFTVTDNMFCAGVENVDTCQGDSGGPAVHGTGDDAVIYGIVSWGYGCSGTHPGVYTRVSRYIEWINNQY